MTVVETPSGWYPNPSGAPGQRYWDGTEWTMYHAPGNASAPSTPVGAVVTGPNHVLHAILSLLTCGAWLWVWLIVAAQNTKRVRQIDAYGNVVTAPMTPEQIAAAEANRRAQMIGGAICIGFLVFVWILSLIIAPR